MISVCVKSKAIKVDTLKPPKQSRGYYQIKFLFNRFANTYQGVIELHWKKKKSWGILFAFLRQKVPMKMKFSFILICHN